MNEVKENEPFLPAIEPETEVDHFLEEPNDDCPSVYDVLSFNKQNTKYPALEDFSCEVKYSLRTDGGGMASYATQGENELNLQALDGILDEIDEVEDLDCANGLTGSCEDYFLDIDLAQEVYALNCGPSSGLRFDNSSSDSHSPGYGGSSNGPVGMSEMSTVTTAPDTKCREESCKRMSRCTCLLGSQNINKKNRKSAAIVGRVSVNVGEKRQRKPPQRYIEESSKANARHRQTKDSAVIRDKLPLLKEPEKKHTRLSESESEDNSSASESEFELLEKRSAKNVDRRKHQRMWTVQEVTTLVEGIREFGVGHWTDIKRLSFASSAYRTPIDLRDKWRNLLRASHAQQPEKGEAEQREKTAGRPLPKSLLRRIQELAARHPYPRKTKTRSSFFRMSS